jgi:hypothetical protein
MFTVASRAADPGEAGARVAAVEVALDDILDDRPEMPVLLLPCQTLCPEVELGARTYSGFAFRHLLWRPRPRHSTSPSRLIPAR